MIAHLLIDVLLKKENLYLKEIYIKTIKDMPLTISLEFQKNQGSKAEKNKIKTAPKRINLSVAEIILFVSILSDINLC